MGIFGAMQPLSKQALRKSYRERRINLSVDEFRSLNRQLMEQIRRLDLDGCLTAHLFLPIEGNREPDTYAIADWLRQQYPGIRLVLPKTEQGHYGMIHTIWDKNTTLTPNQWGIPEPVGGTAVLPREIDAVFVPLLVFDKQGNRIGYGKGFYDRFLAECRPTVKKIGVSLFEAVEGVSDISPHDVPLDRCVTPTRIWSFNTVP